MYRALTGRMNMGPCFMRNVKATNTGQGWIKDADRRHLHYPVDRYLEEFSFWFEWAGIRIKNWHRPLAAYMTAFLEHGLNLNFFSEPGPLSGDEASQHRFRRVPWFVVMEWQRAAVSSLPSANSA